MKIYEDFTPEQKKFVKTWIFFSAVAVSGFVVTLFLFYGISAIKEIGIMRNKEKIQISVQGEGKVFAKPDIAKITATVLSDKVKLADAQKENSDLSGKVIESLKKNNIAEKDIQTVSYNIYPQYSYPAPCFSASSSVPCSKETQKPEIISYQIRSTFQITVRDIAKSGDVLDGIIKSGVNEVSNFQLAVEDARKFQEEAREKAIGDGQKQAQAIALSLGKKLGRIVAFSESGIAPQPIPFGLGGAGENFSKNVAIPSIQPGENEVASAIMIIYELR